MDNTTSSNKHPLVPPNEQKCVWMTAGILSYQLCDRQFDCDHCPLDSALRTFPERGTVEQRQMTTTPQSKQKKALLPGYLYSKKHCWIKPLEANCMRVGIEPFLSSMLLNAKTAVLPSIGDHLQMNKVCAWVVLEGGTLAISSPLDGDVQRTNALIVDQPHGIHDDPFGQGWIFDISTNEDVFNLSSLFRMPEADTHFVDDERRFQSLVTTELKKHRTVAGATLADGGTLVEDISAMLGPDKYFTLLSQVYS